MDAQSKLHVWRGCGRIESYGEMRIVRESSGLGGAIVWERGLGKEGATKEGATHQRGVVLEFRFGRQSGACLAIPRQPWDSPTDNQGGLGFLGPPSARQLPEAGHIVTWEKKL